MYVRDIDFFATITCDLKSLDLARSSRFPFVHLHLEQAFMLEHSGILAFMDFSININLCYLTGCHLPLSNKVPFGIRRTIKFYFILFIYLFIYWRTTA